MNHTHGTTSESTQIHHILWLAFFVFAFGVLLLMPKLSHVPIASASGGVPTTTAITIDYNDNVKTVVLTFDEAVKTTTAATNNFDLSKLHLRNTVGGADLIDISDNTISETASSTTVTITLTEAERATLIQSSGVTGGDSGKIVVVIEAGAAYSGATDEANVSGTPVTAAAITETADTNAPTISSFVTGSGASSNNPFTESFVATFSETMKISSLTYSISPDLGVSLTASWSSGNTVVSLSPSPQFAADTSFTVTITAAPDLASNAFTGGNSTVTFTTQTGGGGSGSGAAAPSYLPGGLSVSINNGKKTTDNPVVDLNLQAQVSHSSGLPIEMMISNSEDFSGSVWRAYQDQAKWTLSEGVGQKAVYVKFRNSYGVTQVISASIELVEVGAVVDSESGDESAEPSGEEGAVPERQEGTLVFGPDQRTVYVLEDGKWRPFRNAGEFLSYGFRFDQVSQSIAEDWARETGEIKLAADGSLLKLPSERTVYLFDRSQLHAFPSLKVFLDHGYNTKNIVIVDSLNDYSIGEPVQ